MDVDLPYQDAVNANEFPALLTEFRRDLNAYLGARPGAPDTLAEVIAFNRADPVELSKFGQELFEQAEAAPPPTDPVYLAQRRTATDAARRSIDETLARFDLDAIMAPTNSPAWQTDYAAGDAFVLGSSGPAAVAGYPNVSVPAGLRRPAADRHLVLRRTLVGREGPRTGRRVRAGSPHLPATQVHPDDRLTPVRRARRWRPGRPRACEGQAPALRAAEGAPSHAG